MYQDIDSPIVVSYSALLLSCVLTLIQCSHPECGLESSVTRIYQGNPVQRGRYPWMVLVSDSNSGTCGGTIINNQFILTAAHCVVGVPVQSVQVFIGAHERNDDEKLKSEKVSSVIINPKYHGQDNDIALIKLAFPLTFNSTFSPICIPSPNLPVTNLLVSGWGDVRSGNRLVTAESLNECNLKEVPRNVCEVTYLRFGIWKRVNPNTQVCAGHSCAAAQGDSGGPLATRNGGHVYQIGIVSEGLNPLRQTKLDIYERVTTANQLAWISHNTKGAKYCYAPDQFFF